MTLARPPVSFACLRWLLLISLLLGGCASNPYRDARNALLSGNPESALAAVDQLKHSTRNALLALMERGLILHEMGQYKQSAETFIKAEKKLDELDQISVSEQAKTLVTSDWAGIYRGEYSERLWIHTYQMMNYLLLADFETAAVEARMALKVLDEHEEALKDDLFTRALIALSFESAGKFNDAYIEYRKLAERLPSKKLIARELYWTALRAGLTQEAQTYRPLLTTSIMRTDPDQLGELIVFVAHGVIPQKIAGNLIVAPDIRISFPQYPPVQIFKPRYHVLDLNKQAQFEEITTLLPDVARTSLNARAKTILAKEAARASAKYNLAHQLKKNNETAGQLLSIAFFLLEEADTRSWSTLPATLSLLRIPLPPGQHAIRVEAGAAELIDLDDLTLEKGQRIYKRVRF